MMITQSSGNLKINESINMEELYLGHDVKYWLELEKRVLTLGVMNYLEEIAILRAKVSFYESRIKEMDEFSKKIK